MRSLTDVLLEGGQPAVDQLRAFARQAFRRFWSFGLLTEEDVAEVLAIRKADGEVRAAPAPARRVPFTMHAAPAPAGRIAPTPPAPTQAPARAIPFRP